MSILCTSLGPKAQHDVITESLLSRPKGYQSGMEEAEHVQHLEHHPILAQSRTANS